MPNLLKKFYLAVFIVGFIFNINSVAQTNQEKFKFEAQNQMSSGKYGEAIDLLNKYISAFPQRADGYNLRGLCFEKQKQYELAVYDFRSARKLEPNNSEINNYLKRTTDAWYSLLYNKIEGYKREIAINPDKAVNYLNIGKCYKNLGNWKEAENWYDEYLKKEKASTDEIIRYSEILAKNNHINKGWLVLKKYVEKYPNDHRLLSKYGYFSMWLGKRKTAIDAFEDALALKPFFKEAMNGMDLVKGRGYVFTVNDTSSRYNYGLPVRQRYSTYPIDKYYRRLSRNPSDTTARYLLIEELLKSKRYEEALAQINILEKTNSSSPKFIALKNKVISERNKYYSDKIAKLKEKLKENPTDKNALLKLAEYYSLKKDYVNATGIYEKYLGLYPDDNEARYNYAQVLSWNNDLCLAKENADILVNKESSNLKYKLFDSKLSIWLNEDLDNAYGLLQEVVQKEPKNAGALILLSEISLSKENIADAEYYYKSAYKIEPDNYELKKIEYNIELAKENKKENDLFAVVQKAREEAARNNCSEAITDFKNYLSNPSANKSVRVELANAYICNGEYNSAIGIYDEMLNEAYDRDIAVQRAKTLLWYGDSLKALNSFKELSMKNPDDAELKLYLGDSYFKMGQYENAKQVYSEMLEKSPNSKILRTRMSWLGVGIESGVFTSFPTYFLISPEAYFYNDNLNFKYNLNGAGLQVGVTNYLSVGVNAYRGRLSSDSSKQNITMFKGSLYLKLSKIVSASGSYGKTYFQNNINADITDLTIKAEEKDHYSVSFNLSSMDAAQILYSPYLVNRRLSANNYSLIGSITLPSTSTLILSGKYSYITVSDDNAGNNFLARIGKVFDKYLTAGYEYYYYNFKNSTYLYWSPSNFESHSVWADVKIVKTSNAELGLHGKIGVIPGFNYILKEISVNASYKLFEGLTIEGSVFAGSSVKQNVGYSSNSFRIAAFWVF